MGKVNFFVIGQPKCGTTSIFHYFKKHSSVFISEQKQLYFFAKEHNNHRRQFKDFNTEYYTKYYNYNFEDYIARFDFAKEYTVYGDITPDYVYSKNSEQDIYDYNPEAKVVLILREPLAFLKSFHNQLIQSGREFEEDFLKALSYQERRKEESFKNDEKTHPVFFQYDYLVNYLKFVKSYHRLFKDNFKVVIYEDFRKDNQSVLNLLCDFLSIERFEELKQIEANKSVTGTGKMNMLKRNKVIRFISSKIPWKLKYWIKNNLLHYLNKSKKSEDVDNEDNNFDKNFRENLFEAVKELDGYLIKHDLYLVKQGEKLINKWSYV